MPADRNTKIVSAKFGNENAKSIATYESLGGYASLRKAFAMKPADIVAEVKASNLRGRAAAGIAATGAGLFHGALAGETGFTIFFAGGGMIVLGTRALAGPEAGAP